MTLSYSADSFTEGLAISAWGSIPVACGLLGTDTTARRVLRGFAFAVIGLTALVLIILANADFENQ